MPTPPDETGDAQTGDVAMGTNTDPPATETELGAGKNGDEDPSEEPTHPPSVAVPSIPTSESSSEPLDPQDPPSLHPSCTPSSDQTIPLDPVARLPSEQSATGCSPDLVTDIDSPQSEDTSPVLGETQIQQEQSQDDTNNDTVNTEQKPDTDVTGPRVCDSPSEPDIDPQVVLAQIEAETQELELENMAHPAESVDDDAVVNPEEILAEIEAEIRAETQNYNTNDSETEEIPPALYEPIPQDSEEATAEDVADDPSPRLLDTNDQDIPVNPVETIVETEESEPTEKEISAGPRNSTGLPPDTLSYLSSMENLDAEVQVTPDTDLKTTQVLGHTDSHTDHTQQSEKDNTESTDSHVVPAPGKASESISSADFVMIQHEDFWKEITKDSPEDVQVKEKDSPEEDGGDKKDEGGDGSNSEDPGSQQNDDQQNDANSNQSVTEEKVTEPIIKIDVPTVSVTVQINDPKDQTTTDGQAASNAAEAENEVSELPSAVQRRVKGGGSADENKRRSLMLWVDADLVQTVGSDQGTKSPQHSPEDIPSDLKRLKKVIRKERWASDTEHEVRKEMWKTLCLKNSSGASVSHVYHEVEEGLFGKETDSVDPSSITLPSFVDPDHPASAYALKSEGQARLNRLLCVLADTRPDILFCPLLAPLAGMLLHYMSPEETFDGLSALLGSTRYKFLEVSWVEHESFRISFEKLAARFAASAHKMFIKQGDVAEIYQDWIWWILEDLPFSHVIRVMDCYLSEGLKIFYRVGLAILMLYKKHKGTAEAPDGVAASIREFVRSIPVSPNTLLTVGFQFRGLSRSVIGTFQTKHKETLREDNSPYRAASRRQNSVITKLNQISSSIITHQQLHTIWSWIPTRFSIYQPSLVFTTQEHGFSLTTFYTRCEYCEPTILLIKTSDQEIFGAFLSSSWSTRNDGDHKGIYFGTGESFLFSFAPEEKKYPWVGILPKEEAKEEEKEEEKKEKKEEEEEVKENGGVEGEDGERRASGASGGDLKKKMNEMFMRASPSLVAVGGGDGDGILIEGDLTKGFSTHCLTFENPGLAKERSFNCDVIEVITMEDGRNPLNGVTA